VYYVTAYNNPVAPILSLKVGLITDSPAITGLQTNGTTTAYSPSLSQGASSMILVVMILMILLIQG